MRQVMPIAGGLAGGLALSSFGTISRGLNWGLGSGRQMAWRATKSLSAVAMQRTANESSRTGETV